MRYEASFCSMGRFPSVVTDFGVDSARTMANYVVFSGNSIETYTKT